MAVPDREEIEKLFRDARDIQDRHDYPHKHEPERYERYEREREYFTPQYRQGPDKAGPMEELTGLLIFALVLFAILSAIF